MVFVCAAARAWIFGDTIIEMSAAYLGHSSLEDDVASMTVYRTRLIIALMEVNRWFIASWGAAVTCCALVCSVSVVVRCAKNVTSPSLVAS